MPGGAAADGVQRPAEGREWWVQLQRERQEALKLQRRAPRAGPPWEPVHRSLDDLQLALLSGLEMTPELAADSGRDWPLCTEGGALLPPFAALAPQSSAAATSVTGVAPGGEGCEGAAPGAPQQQDGSQPGRRSLLLKASHMLLHKMAQHQQVEADTMSRLATADEAAAEAASAAVAAGSSDGGSSGGRRVVRTGSDARHLADVLQNGSELVARANNASSTWRSMQSGRAGPCLQGPAAAGAAACGGYRHSGGGCPSAGLATIREGEGGQLPPAVGRATGESSFAHTRGQRKSLLGLAGSAGSGSGSSSALSLSLGMGGSTEVAGGGGTRAGKRTSLSLPSAGGSSWAAQRRWEEEQEAELAEVFRMGAFGDPEIQEYLVKELSRKGRRPRGRGSAGSGSSRAGVAGARPAAAGGAGEEEWEEDGEEDDGGRLDPIVQAWLVTKVPAPRVEGYAPPPSRTACRLIAAQEMQKYYMHQKRRTGSFFKWLGLTQEQAGDREPTGTFVVGTEEKAAEAPRKTFKGMVRKSVVVTDINQMVKNAQATVWAREHVEQVAQLVARGLARQRAVRAWQSALAKIKALPREAVAAWGPLPEQAGAADTAPQQGEADAAGAQQGGADAAGAQQGAHARAPPESAEQTSEPPQQQQQVQGQAPAHPGAQGGDGSGSIRAAIAGGVGGGARPSAAGGLSRASSQLGQRPAAQSRAASFKRLEGQGGKQEEGTGACHAGQGGTSHAGAGRLQSASGDRRLTAAAAGAASEGGARSGGRASQPQGGRVSAAGAGAIGGGGQSQQRQLADLASVAAAAMEQHKRRGGRERLSKLPPLPLDKLERSWCQQVARLQDTERQRQEQRAREQLCERWAALQQRRAAAQE